MVGECRGTSWAMVFRNVHLKVGHPGLLPGLLLIITSGPGLCLPGLPESALLNMQRTCSPVWTASQLWAISSKTFPIGSNYFLSDLILLLF